MTTPATLGAGTDHLFVRKMRQQVADRLNQQRRRDEIAGRPADVRRGRAPVRPVAHRPGPRGPRPQPRSATGQVPPTAEEEEVVAAAIHAALFGVGRLQPLLDDPEVENIDINGCDRVFVGYADGREEMAEPVAETDEELVELIQVLAAYVGLTSRPFDSANPQLDLRLPDGSRLSAVMDVYARPGAVHPPGPAGQGLPRRPGRQRDHDRRDRPPSSRPRSARARTS